MQSNSFNDFFESLHNKPGLNSIFGFLWHASRGVLQQENVHSMPDSKIYHWASGLSPFGRLLSEFRPQTKFHKVVEFPVKNQIDLQVNLVSRLSYST